jgi:GH18 family chitinase
MQNQLITLINKINANNAIKQSMQFSQLKVWMYDFDKIDNKQSIDNLKKYKISAVFLSLRHEWLTSMHEKLNNFIISAHQNNIEVHIVVLEDGGFTFIENHNQAKKLTNDILNYCKQNPQASFDGIHIDTEPHTLQQWSQTDWVVNENLMQQYVQLIKTIKEQITLKQMAASAISGKPFGLSAAVGWWYNEQFKSGNLPSGSAKNLCAYLDFIVLMVYDGVGKTVEDIIQKSSDEIEGAKTTIGIDPRNFSSLSALNNAVDKINNLYINNPTYAKNYNSVCFFEYAALINLAA